MNARLAKFARAIGGVVPGTLVHEDIMILDLAQHFALCLVLERTSRKSACFLWAVVYPLFDPTANLTLNYAWRCRPTCGEYIELPDQNVEGWALEITLKIEADLVELRSLGSTGAFMRRFPLLDDEQRPNKILNFAVAEYLVGNVARARLLFRRLEQWPGNHRPYETCRVLSREYLLAIDTGDEKCLAMIKKIEDANLNHVLGVAR